MGAMLIQEGQVAGWELGHIDGPFVWHQQIFVLFCWFALLWGLTFLIRCWRRLRIRSASTKTALTGILTAVRKGNLESALQEAEQIPNRSPERGLRKGNKEDGPAIWDEILPFLISADATFQYEVESLKNKLSSFGTMVAVIGWSCLLYFFIDISWMLRVIGEVKATGTSAIVTAAAEIMVGETLGLSTLVILFIVHRHLLVRIKNRITYWNFFVAQMREILVKRKEAATEP